MGKGWDDLGSGARQQEWHVQWLREAYRVLVPGGPLFAFSGTRTFHRLAAAMEQAEFTLVPLQAWIQGQGFPKSTNISKSIDKKAGATREVVGYKRGVGGENLNDLVRGGEVRTTDQKGAKGVGAYGTGAKQVAIDIPVTVPATELAKIFDGYGTALKPSWEPILVGVKAA